jgi:hypothetical protein
MKIGQEKAELFHVDGRTDTKKLIVFFFNFTKAPKNSATNKQRILYDMQLAYINRFKDTFKTMQIMCRQMEE